MTTISSRRCSTSGSRDYSGSQNRLQRTSPRIATTMSTHTNHPASRRHPRSLLVGIALAILVAGISTPPALGGSLTIEAPNVTAYAGQTASFDILLVNNDSTSYKIAGDAFT